MRAACLTLCLCLSGLLALATPTQATANLSQKEMPVTPSLTLKADRLYQAVFIAPKVDVEPGQAAALYFGGGADVATEHGVRTLQTFTVTHIEHGDIDTHYVVLLEWPSLQAVESLRQDVQWAASRTHRDAALDDLGVVYFRPQADATLAFSPAGVYEVAAFWMNRHSSELMAQYFQQMSSLVKKAQPRPLVQTEVVKTRSPYDLRPDTFNLLEWGGGREAREAMFDSDAFRASGYLRALALDRLLTVMIAPN